MRPALVQLLGTQITKTWPLLSPQHFWEEGSSREAQDAVETLEGPPPRSLVFKTRAPSLPKPSLGLTHYVLIMLRLPGFWNPFGIHLPGQGPILAFSHCARSCLFLCFSHQ